MNPFKKLHSRNKKGPKFGEMRALALRLTGKRTYRVFLDPEFTEPEKECPAQIELRALVTANYPRKYGVARAKHEARLRTYMDLLVMKGLWK